MELFLSERAVSANGSRKGAVEFGVYCESSRLCNVEVLCRTSRKKFAQNLHRFQGDIEFAQFLHNLDSCTKFAQVFSPEAATIYHKILANKGIYLILYGQ
jgi:hypothetical protein